VKRIDLHLHTTASDGASTPREVVDSARALGLAAISITDHDSVEALPAAFARSREVGLEMIPGIELSVEVDGSEVHLLGYLFDHRDPGLLQRLEDLRQSRRQRAELMLERLRSLGVDLDMPTIFPDGLPDSVGRLHIARALFQHGFVGSTQEAFARYIGNHGPAYVPKLTFSLEDALGTIRRLGGIPVLAHPGQLNRDELIPRMVELGLGGLETYYTTHTQFQVNHYTELARYYGLAITGGSDCHGTNKGRVVLGTVPVPYSVLENLYRLKGGAAK